MKELKNGDLDLSEFLASLPSHKCGLHISHNEYKDTYETIEDAVRELDDYWASNDEALAALKSGEIWIIMWYPDTPVGCCMVAASTLEAALKASAEGKE